MEDKNEITTKIIRLQNSFEDFVWTLENRVLQFISQDWSTTLNSDPDNFENYVRGLAGVAGLVIFSVQDHGPLLSNAGFPAKAKQYMLGNPISAVKITKLDLGAALYAPLRILVYQDGEGDVFVCYDLPSSLFSRFGDAVRNLVKGLDDLIYQTVIQADNSSLYSPAP